MGKMEDSIQVLELRRTGQTEEKILTRDQFVAVISQSNLPFR